jgi:hypothetical protein
MSYCDKSYLVVFPLYLIVDFQRGNSAEAVVVEGFDDGCRGVAVFTEELLAERYRDDSRRNVELVKLKSRQDMENLIDNFEKGLQVTHVAIDPIFNNAKKAVWMPLNDFWE